MKKINNQNVTKKITLKWMSATRAAKYIPTDRTIMIRTCDKRKEFEPLQSNKYVGILKLKFNDIDILEKGYDNPDDYMKYGRKRNHDNITIFDEMMAKQILEFVKKYIEITDTIIVHCRMGINRSRGIILALNEIFNLGHDLRFNSINHWIYHTLKTVSDNLKNVNINNDNWNI